MTIEKITKDKFETFYNIRKEYRHTELLKDSKKIVKIAKEKYDVILTENDIEEIKKNYDKLMWKYIN